MKHSHKNLYPKGFRKRYFSLAAILALNSALLAQSQNVALNEKSNLVASQDLKLSIAHRQEFVENADFKEEFDAREIAQSNARNIYDFLNTHSLLKITTNYGNPYTANIDLRGFGQNGHKNLAIIVDGMRLDNIDSAPVSLSSIPLDSIEKIEIFKGKGTTKYGNGATSGILKITTKRTKGGALNVGYASYDTLNSQFFAREVRDTLNIGVYGQYQHNEGSRKITQGSEEKDGSYNKNGGITAFYQASDSTLLKSNLNYSKYAIKYANPLTKAQFEKDPTLAPLPSAWGGDTFTHQKRWDLLYSLGFTNFSDSGIITDVNFGGNRSESEYINFNNQYDGKGFFGDFNSSYRNNSYLAEIGGTLKKDERLQNTGAKAQVDSMLLYLNGEKYFGDSTINAGISTQRVISKTNESQSDNLWGGELGIHHNLTPQTALFASYSRSFVVPNVDYFFDWQGNLNPLMDTATFDTYQIGSKTIFGIHELSGNLFYINGKDEAYYEAITFQNKSLGKTRRIGGEANFTTHFSSQVYSRLSYAYVDSTIRSGAYQGNTIPGVSKHTLSASLNYLPIAQLNLGISYKYGSKMYDYNDFDNRLTKSPNYQSLNLNASYTLKSFEIYAYVQNLTDHKNAIVVSGGYYPYEFERVFGGGIKYTW
ncbi:TonB-dependent receptor [Helicobacter sp. MIT 05-5294]|uniref:TonB-dependent receptor n=1 Tax=Helicobacter sp. MIT 05-5294 TaxID=1548150 RepID=UPI00051FA3DB|nr:TonB-dependent receptor [Helicobacter sp. MIT 05-5294]TLD86325.1 TonB-dependent receptor [Helicobacter sp. MIT 05-5294]